MAAVFIKLLNMSISASWIVLAVLVLRLLLKKAPKWITVVLWGLVALRLVLPFSIESAFSLIPSKEAVDPEIIENYTPETEVDTPVDNETNAPAVNETVKPSSNETVPSVNVETVPPVVTVPSVPSVTVPPVVVVPPVSNVTLPPALDETNAPVLDETASPVVNETDTPVISDVQEPKPAKNTMQTVMNVISIVWLAGIAAMAIYTAVSYYLLRKKIDTAVRFRDNIYKSENVDSPFVIGMIKPKIYLPFNIKEQDAEYVIAHENAHIKRLDYIWKPLGFILLTVYWFNPVMWLGYILLCRDIELACDEKVIAGFDSEQRADYSEALLSCSVNRKVIAACPIAFGEVGVKDRIKSVLNYKKPALWIIILAVVAIIATALCFLTDPISKKESSGNEGTESEDTDDSEESEGSKEPDVTISDSFLSLLKSEKTFIDESGKSVYLKDYRLGTNNGVEGPYAVPREYAIVDFDSDGTNEMMVFVSHYYGTSMVFREYNDNVYGYEFGEKEIENLKTDGAFTQSKNNGDTVSYFEGLTFEGTTYQITEKAYANEATQKYRLNGDTSPQESVIVYKRDFNRKTSVKWIEYYADTNKSQETDKQPDNTLPLSFLNVLNNKMTYKNESGEDIYFKYYLDGEFTFGTGGQYKYTMVDFDSDGTEELVVNAKSYGGYIILRVYNYNVYGYELNSSEINDLYIDGSFRQQEESNKYKYFNLKFDGASYQITDRILTSGMPSVKWMEQQFNMGSLPIPEKQPETPEPFDYRSYYDFLIELCSNNPEKIWGFFVKDIDNNGVDELIVGHEENVAKSVYTYDGGVKLVGKHEFLTGTTRLLETKDPSYPGLICFTVGGGAEHYVYLTIKDGQLSFEKIWDDNYSGTYDTPTTEHTTDKKLIEVSANAYNNNQDIEMVYLSLFAVLNSKKPYIDETGKSVYLKDFDTTNSDTTPVKFAMVNFDGEEYAEMVVSVRLDGAALMVFRDDMWSDNVYGYQFNFRELSALKKDGSFTRVENHRTDSISRLEFEGTTYKVIEKAYADTFLDIYRLDGVTVTREEIIKYNEESSNVPYLRWIYYIDNTYIPTNEELRSMYMDVLDSKKTFISHLNQPIYLKDYVLAGNGYENIYMQPEEYVILDLDSDGIEEMVVNGSSDYGAVMVFHYFNGKIYGNKFGIRSLHSIKTDGSYWASSSAFENSILKLEFEGTSYKEVEIAYHNTTDNVYRINGVNATKEESEKFESEWEKIPQAVWINWQDIDSVEAMLVNYFKTKHEEYKDHPYTANSYALYDMNGDGTNELLYWDDFHLVVCAYQNGVVKSVYYDGFNAMNGPIVVLENGAILSRNDGTGSVYYYETLNADYTITRIYFDIGEFGEYGNHYNFEGKSVSKEEWLELTKPYFDIPEAPIEWLSLDKDPTVPEHEFYIDVNFDSKLDKLVPYQRTASGVYYKAYVWNEAKGDYVYAEGFENCPNISIDTERKVLLSSRTASMITSYSIITFDGMKFDSIRGIYWEPAENYTKIHFVEKEYIREPDYPWENFCKSYLEVEHKNVNVDMLDLLTPDKTDEQIKGYFEAGSFWDLDGARWKNYVFNMDIEPKPGFLPFSSEPKNFLFCSGAGAWSTQLYLNADGTFNGYFHDSNMGETGDGYPNGTMYECTFSGKFENIEKINDYSYKMTLAYVNTEKPSGQEWIENGVKHISSGPYGIDGGKNFVLYLPGTPTSELHEEFFRWYLYCNSDPGSTLPVYGLRNVETNEGFF